MNFDRQKRGLRNAKLFGSKFVKGEDVEIMLSPEEMAAIFWIFTAENEKIDRVAELGAYTGGSSNLFAELSKDHARIEVYDFFKHNDSSEKKLREHPKWNADGFFEIWKHNTKKFAHKFDVHVGNICDTCVSSTAPLDILFVDIVKHPSVVPVLARHFYRRLRIGGYLLHQDYFHWQSPWVVYQMELLENCFELLGNFGNNMTIYVKKSELRDEQVDADYLDGLSYKQKYRLMDRAIARNPGNRAGLLSVSKLRLSLDDPDFDTLALHREIKKNYSTQRIHRYADSVLKNAPEIAGKVW